MNVYLAEFLGTAILLLLGNGVVANVVLDQTKGNNSGWIVIAGGWGLAVFVAVVCTGEFSGAHINPAVTLGTAAAGTFKWALVPGYIAAQLAGGFVGAVLVYVLYHDHYHVTDDADSKLATFCTSPAIRSPVRNFLNEVVATFVLVLTVLLMADATFAWDGDGPTGKIGLGSVGALPVGLLVVAIGLSLGGTTGYAINPARDLSPRVAHALLPIAGKRDSDWSYSWIPVLGPITGGLLASLLYRLSITQAL